MAKFSKTINHDYMRFSATFPDGMVLKGNYSRNGHSVTIEPYDPETARKVATVFHNVDHTGVKDFNLGSMFAILEPVAQNAKSVDQLLAEFAVAVKDSIGVDISRQRPLETREATAAAIGKRGRSVEVAIKFENGEDFTISIAGKSVGYTMKPDYAIFSNRVSSMVFGFLNAFTPQELAEKIKTDAEAGPDIETMIETMKFGINPASKNAHVGPKR
ncbi:hypothetical protein HFN89_04960 [Rhizobium laguerreae]|nr:hypothetical protein [Rhizobium laguerreae]